MPCEMLHVIERPDPDPYRDPEVKDVIGGLPAFFCACVMPLQPLAPSSAVTCLRRNSPCSSGAKATGG